MFVKVISYSKPSTRPSALEYTISIDLAIYKYMYYLLLLSHTIAQVINCHNQKNAYFLTINVTFDWNLILEPDFVQAISLACKTGEALIYVSGWMWSSSLFMKALLHAVIGSVSSCLAVSESAKIYIEELCPQGKILCNSKTDSFG